MNVIDAIRDERLFRPLFKDLKSWNAWIVFLKTVFALPLDPAELGVYRQCTGRAVPPSRPFPEIFAIVGRRGGKSFIASVEMVS